MEKDIDLGNLLILGDSYSTFEGHMPQGCGSYYRPSGEPETDVRRVEDTWWHRLISQVECDLVLNHSWTGSTICNTIKMTIGGGGYHEKYQGGSSAAPCAADRAVRLLGGA